MLQTLGDIASILGVLFTIVGFAFTLWPIRKSQTAVEAVSKKSGASTRFKKSARSVAHSYTDDGKFQFPKKRTSLSAFHHWVADVVACRAAFLMCRLLNKRLKFPCICRVGSAIDRKIA